MIFELLQLLGGGIVHLEWMELLDGTDGWLMGQASVCIATSFAALLPAALVAAQASARLAL